jgi:hypothetical protein
MKKKGSVLIFALMFQPCPDIFSMICQEKAGMFQVK